MRKILLILVLMLFLSGCTVSDENESEYLFTSLGFDIIENEYIVTAEAVVPNGENLILEGKGATLKKALGQISRKSTQGIFFSHCGLVVLGDSIEKQNLQHICEYLLKLKITLSAMVVKTENANKMLNNSEAKNVAVGYDVMDLVSHYSKEKDKPLNNRFFSIAANVSEGEKVAVPLITTSESGYYFEKRNAYIQ